jgi:hypothetical protein
MGLGEQDAVTMKLTLLPNRHPDADTFENYAFERLSGAAVAEFEEHLLVCEDCQGTFAETEEYIRLMKAATVAYIGKQNGPRQSGFRERGLRRNAVAAAVLLLTCLTALLSWRTPPGEPKIIVLNAYRGAGSQAPSWRPLELQIDLKDVQPAAAYRVEIVDSTGRRVWFGGTPARLNKGLAPGVYWVRLSTDTGEALREYGLDTVNTR